MSAIRSFLPADRATAATFIKTDSPQIVEVLALCGLDYVILDAEHAPFDRNCMDRMIMAARGSGLPMLVRIADHRDATISSVLDLGAAGIVVPHVDSAADAANVVAAARFAGGRRGWSGSARFGGYGTSSLQETLADGDSTLVVCQIESGAAIEALDEIAAVGGIAGLFVGRADLALSLGSPSFQDPAVMAGVVRSVEAADAHNLPVLLTVENEADVTEFMRLGVRSFVFGSDQSLLRRAASRLRQLLPPRNTDDHSTA